MAPDALARYLQRLPTLITFFFSVMLVTVFRELSVTFDWTTGPSFRVGEPGDVLTLLSFASTLFFVVTVWLSYALLIERFPYTLDYTVFIFDVVRFSVLFMIFNFAFLAGHPPAYLYYPAALAVFHVLMAGWHAYRRNHIQGSERAERALDARGHIVRAVTYALLATVYLIGVTWRWEASPSWAAHAAIVVVTSGLLVYWNARRLSDMRTKALPSAGAAAPSLASGAASITEPVRIGRTGKGKRA